MRCGSSEKSLLSSSDSYTNPNAYCYANADPYTNTQSARRL